MRDSDDGPGRDLPGLAEIGLANYPPYLMNRIMGRYNASIRDEMAKLGLTTPKMRALAVLSVMDGQLIGQLAVHAIVEQSTLSRALDALQSEGLIRRETDPGDSRATRVFITQSGRAAFAALWPHMAEAYRAMFRGVSAEEQRVFVATLQKIHANIRKHDF
ncbi:MAG: MarR family transcriptional regulator [Paracoccaceae bacterium]